MMNIVCPTCQASYSVPDAVVAAMRPVQCARCKNEWVPGAVAEGESPGEAAAPAYETDAAPAAPGAPAETAMPEPAPVPQTVAPVAAPPAESPVPEVAVVTAPVAPIVTPPPPVPPPVKPAPVAARPVMPQPAAPRPDAALRAPAPSTPAQPVLAWVVSIVLILAFIGGGIAFRAGVMKAWPPSTRLYAALGLYRSK